MPKLLFFVLKYVSDLAESRPAAQGRAGLRANLAEMHPVAAREVAALRHAIRRVTLHDMSDLLTPRRAAREVRSFRLTQDVVDHLDPERRCGGLEPEHTVAECFLEEALRLVNFELRVRHAVW